MCLWVKEIVFDITIQMTLEWFLAQRSNKTTKLTVKKTNNSFRTWFLSSKLITALEHLEIKTFRLPQIISNVIDKGLEKSKKWKKILKLYLYWFRIALSMLNKHLALSFLNPFNFFYFFKQCLYEYYPQCPVRLVNFSVISSKKTVLLQWYLSLSLHSLACYFFVFQSLYFPQALQICYSTRYFS